MTSATAEPTLSVDQEEGFSRHKPKRTSSLDGSLHVPSTHRGGKRPNPLDLSHSQRGDPSTHVGGDATAVVEEPQIIEGHSATELTDDIDLPNPKDDDDVEDGDSFCDADDMSSPDIKCLRREMSVTPDDLEDFIVEFGGEIAEAAKAYYDDEDGDKIAVPRTHVVPVEEKEKDGGGEKDDQGEATNEEGAEAKNTNK
mmetsp:Transcript_4894/g.9751  ORF Transcript_4894/g.9751 Transcript_4894/m.9751 type:complete len:198 (-) Transcript_4894:187-780(-)